MSPQDKQTMIRKFQTAYKQEFDQEITEQEALEMANNLVNLFRVIYRPIPKQNFNNENS
ncbi:MAG: hypothetical protein WC675_03615 [Patescibacteria group bacterium]